MADAVDVAYYMLKIANENSIAMTNLKLQKLVYIAHGYMLAINGEPLIHEAPQAWKYGPVIHSVYRQFSTHGSEKISIDVENLKQLKNIQLNTDEENIIKEVIKAYGDDTAIDLVNLTHERETPWDIIWNKQNGKEQLFSEIPDNIIKSHFQKAVTEPNSVNGL